MGSGASRGGVLLLNMESTSVQTDPWTPGEVATADEGGATGGVVQPISAPIVQSVPKKSPIEESWLAVCQTLDVPEGQHTNRDIIVKRTGWKTIRIFVSSTFKDFQEEREVLVKEVFPDLRAWCEGRRLHLVECDLRWGIPKDTTTELTLRTCLGEIDRCYQDNVMPYFLNMTSERIGWIPEPGEVPQNLVDEYRWVFGLSVTEMEIIHGAYRKDNPNSLFLIRDDSFLESIPASHRNIFIDENPIAVAKLEMLRRKIRDRFPENRVVPYRGQFSSIDPVTNKVKLEFDAIFRDRVMNFFKDRISIQYPLFEGQEDPLQKVMEAHEAFMKSRSELVLGRSNILQEILSHINDGGSDTPLIILGGPGTGKSSILAKVADEIVTRAMNKNIPGVGSGTWKVFYHFVGAVPGSTDLRQMLVRLLKYIGVVDDSNMPSDLDSAVQLSCSALNNSSTPPIILCVDALNQFDEDRAASLVTWVPRKLSPKVRCVFSMIQDTPQHKHLMSRESKPVEVILPALSLSIRKDMIAEYLGKFNKRLDMDQMILLLSKKSSENPLWLSIACEELRIYGQFRQIGSMIDNMADGLLEILEQILDRFEKEGGGSLLVSTLCLLEVSATGLLESELLFILADEEALIMPQKGQEKGIKEESEKKKKKEKKYTEKLSAYKWAGIYRSLRPFLRPFGNSGEGRLDFYHRSLSKVVRNKYLHNEGDEETLSPVYRWWHSKLAEYFQHSDNYDRKVEEYPYHLIKLRDTNRLEKTLAEWQVFDRLFDKEFSSRLMKYWQECGGKEQVLQCYSEKLLELQEENTADEVLCQRYEQVGRFLVQMGEYTFSEDLCVKALDIEKTKLGNRPKRLVELYNLMANIWDQRSKLHEFCSADQVPQLMECVSYNMKAVEIFETLSGKYYQVMVGKQYIKMAFALASLTDCGGSQEISSSQALKQGNDMIEKAISRFIELEDNGNLAEAYMTQAVLCRNNTTKQIKLYNQALDLCTQAYGRYHPLCGRINFNTAICYEDARDFDKAYNLFKENYIINKEVYGEGHVKYQRSRELFNEPTYSRICLQRNDTDFD